MSDFEPFEGKNGKGRYNGMTVSVTETGLYLGAAVCQEVLGDPDAIQYLIDEATGRVGVLPADDDVPSAYAVSGYQARAKPVWDALGVAVDHAEHVPIDTDSEDFPVVDVSEFIAGDANESKNESESEPGNESGEVEDPPLDTERIATALDQVGIGGAVSVDGLLHAADEHGQAYEVADELGITRLDAQDLIRRLDLGDALESEDGLAWQRFKSAEGGETA